MPSSYYHFANIRAMLIEGYSKEDLLKLCFDVPELLPLYREWQGAPISTSRLVQEMLDYAHRHLLVDTLLLKAMAANPYRYAEHQPYVNRDLPAAAGESTPDSRVCAAVAANYLGYGITLGGFYRDVAMSVVATEWTPYGETQVRSGWLYIPQWTANHALAFFKIHVYGDGTGYIHIVDVADPAHTIHLLTSSGEMLKGSFHYLDDPAALWTFNWRQSEQVKRDVRVR
jgi:hypothetical protein